MLPSLTATPESSSILLNWFLCHRTSSPVFAHLQGGKWGIPLRPAGLNICNIFFWRLGGPGVMFVIAPKSEQSMVELKISNSVPPVDPFPVTAWPRIISSRNLYPSLVHWWNQWQPLRWGVMWNRAQPSPVRCIRGAAAAGFVQLSTTCSVHHQTEMLRIFSNSVY